MLFRADLANLNIASGSESLAVQLFTQTEVPWQELAFPTIGRTLQYFFCRPLEKSLPCAQRANCSLIAKIDAHCIKSLMSVLLHYFIPILFCVLTSTAQSAIDIHKTPIDTVRVDKSERRMELLSRGTVVKTYRISLGRNPKGDKVQEGDDRTPEGIYWIDWRKKSLNYQLSMHISYPNAEDRAVAKAKNVPPGGMIMIHGTPINEEFPEWYFRTLDWTNGCIALTNKDMREFWNLVKDGTLIDIHP